jgi:Ca-activated chloride channel family protein
MLARDISPSRLAAAKQIVDRLCAVLPPGRVGAVAFAGHAVLLAPLTDDRDGVGSMLRDANETTVVSQGTRLETGVDRAIEALSSAASGVVVLLSDGEATQGSLRNAAARARRAHVRVVCIGIGSVVGSQVPAQLEAATPVLADGATPPSIITRLDEAALRQLAQDTVGLYASVGTSPSATAINRVAGEAAQYVKRAAVGPPAGWSSIALPAWLMGAAFLFLLTEAVGRRPL